MQTQINYDDFYTSNNTQVIKQITAELSDQIQLSLQINTATDGTKTCDFELIDKIGVGQLGCSGLKAQDIRELIELYKRIYMQIQQ